MEHTCVSKSLWLSCLQVLYLSKLGVERLALRTLFHKRLLICEVWLLLRGNLILLNRETSIEELLLYSLDVFALTQADLDFAIACTNVADLVLVDCGINYVFDTRNLFKVTWLGI